MQLLQGDTPLGAAIPVNANSTATTIPGSLLGAADTAGTATFTVVVTSSDSLTGSDTKTIDYDFSPDPALNANLSFSPAAPITDFGAQVTLTADWTGGTPPYQVQFSKAGAPLGGAVSVDSTNASTTFPASSLGGIGTSGTASVSVEVTSSDSLAGSTTQDIAYNFVGDPTSGVTLEVTSPAADGQKINGAATVKLVANWTSGTSPFSASFKAGGNTLGIETTTGNTATFQVTGATLGHGDGKSFSVEVIEVAVPNSTPATGNGNKTVDVDLQTPIIKTTLNASSFSNVSGNNEVVITVTAENEDISAPQVTVSPAIDGSTVTPADSNPATGRSFKYTLVLNNAADGSYSIIATGKDLTAPTDSANAGTGQASFIVDSGGNGNGAITAITPGTPTSSTNFTLSGTIGTTMDASKGVEILEGGATRAVVANGTINGNTWTAGLNGVSEGQHTYTMRGFDSLGNPTAESAPYIVTVDQHSPSTPTLTQPVSPTGADVITISGTGAIDTGSVKALPVYVNVYDENGTAIASAPAAVDGSFSISGIPLNEGENKFFVRAQDSTVEGTNISGMSSLITVVKDISVSSVNAVYISNPNNGMASMPIPLPESTTLGAGNFKVQVSFSEEMDTSVNPNINVQCGGGTIISSNAGTWVASHSFVGNISIPNNGGAAYNGTAALRVSGAKDAAGNAMPDFTDSAAFKTDSTPPTTQFNSMDAIYVASNTNTLTLAGSAQDSDSGVGYIQLVYQPFNGGTVASISIPIFGGTTANWSHNWDTSTLSSGKFKLWAIAGDRATPIANLESYSTKPYRILMVDKDVPNVSRISLGNNPADIHELGNPAIISSPTTRLTAAISDDGDTGIDFTHTQFTLVHDSTGHNILGNHTNNKSNLIFFDFPQLTENGTYTVTVTPADLAGNPGEAASRSFILDTLAPSSAIFYPGSSRIANESHLALAVSQVWATINDPNADHSKSTIEVKYNKIVAGQQLPNASTTAVIWSLNNTGASLPKDQSKDGRYYVSVTPKDSLGNIGKTVRSTFTYDATPPVIKSFVPDVTASTASSNWFGLTQTEISIETSDAPKDIITYKSNYSLSELGAMSTSGSFNPNALQVPEDSSWYNGQGSGINTTLSSFTYSIDGTESDPATVSGMKFTLHRPAVPADTTVGAQSVQVSFKISDQVNDGEHIPNTNIGSYTLMFDYLAPEITAVTEPVQNGKYCKRQIPISGMFSDKGSSEDIKVQRAEAYVNNTWQQMAEPSIPQKTGTMSASITLAEDKPDGEKEIKFRVIDLGGNISEEKTINYIYDTTPPLAPEMIIPLPDIITNKQGQLFKWAAATDADHYLLQIADDPSFNNIINKADNTDYSDLVGQITIMTEGSFSMPKDGTYYWRVAAIETCVDGHNISEFSPTRKFVVDTVKPTVLSIAPAPSSGNKVSTGMVTFTARFSENLDTTIPVTVTITSHGGQMMTIEMSNFTEDTWTGTTVIPSNNSSLYDGTAIISISSAKDIAGNMMTEDSSNSIIINTGPAFQTKIFSNPANEYEIMIITKSSEALQSVPTCKVQQSSEKTPVTMNFLKNRYYAGSYKILKEYPGRAYIDLAGTDIHGMVGHDSVEFTVADLSASTRMNLSTPSGMATLKASEGSVYTSTAVFMLARENLDSPFNSEIKANLLPGISIAQGKNINELVGIMPLEEVCPANLKLKRCFLYEADTNGLQLKVPADKVHVYRLDHNGFWIHQGGEIANGKIKAQLTGSGRLALMADMTAPSIKDMLPANLENLETPTPLIEGRMVDYGSGFIKETFKLFIDGKEVSGVKADSEGKFKYQVPFALKKGKHEIEVEGYDRAGNQLRSSFWVTAPGRFAIDQFMPYPSPVRGNVMHFNYNFNQNAERVRLRIYDSAGHKITELDTFDFANTTHGRIKWDLRNDSGKRIANGVYFYKLQITKAGKTYKKRGKFAVLR